MAGGGGGEKTEKATPKKRRDEREQGNVLRSQDMSTALMLIGTVAVFKIVIGNMGTGIMDEKVEVDTKQGHERDRSLLGSDPVVAL